MMNFPLTNQSNPPNLVVQLRTSYFHPSNCRGTGIRPSSVISSLCATQYTRVRCVCSFVIALQSFLDHSWDINSDILSGWFQWAWRFIQGLLSNHNGHGSHRIVLNLIISRTQHIISQYFVGCTMHLFVLNMPLAKRSSLHFHVSSNENQYFLHYKVSMYNKLQIDVGYWIRHVMSAKGYTTRGFQAFQRFVFAVFVAVD